LKKAFFHYETAAIAGHEEARSFLGTMYERSGNIEQAVKHWMIAASAGSYFAMHSLQKLSEKGIVSRESIDSALTAFNDSCAEMRS
jgi:TPR repeat protein